MPIAKSNADTTVNQEPSTTNSEPIPKRDLNTGLEIPSDSAAVSRDERVREAAYKRFEQRGYAHGSHDEDWHAAEAEIDGQSST